jgi:hypothetical protein
MDIAGCREHGSMALAIGRGSDGDVITVAPLGAVIATGIEAAIGAGTATAAGIAIATAATEIVTDATEIVTDATGAGR